VPPIQSWTKPTCGSADHLRWRMKSYQWFSVNGSGYQETSVCGLQVESVPPRTRSLSCAGLFLSSTWNARFGPQPSLAEPWNCTKSFHVEAGVGLKSVGKYVDHAYHCSAPS